MFVSCCNYLLECDRGGEAGGEEGDKLGGGGWDGDGQFCVYLEGRK